MKDFDFKIANDFNDLMALSLLNSFYRSSRATKGYQDVDIWKTIRQNSAVIKDPYVETLKRPPLVMWWA